MNIKIQAFQILSVLWLSCVQSQGNGEMKLSESSQEFADYIQEKNILHVVRNVPPYKDFKNTFINKRILEMDVCCMHQEIDDMSAEINYLREIAPHADFICALNFMKYDLTQIFTDVAGVAYVKISQTLEKWPFRIQELRRKYDEYDEFNPGRMYPKVKNEGEDKRKKKDSESYSKWFRFTSTEPEFLIFMKNGVRAADDDEEKWKLAAIHLQGNLTEYYNELDPELRKLRYNDDKKNFSSTFSAIMQRSYRLSCYFEYMQQHNLKAELKKKYRNGTEVFFQTAIQRLEQDWYFPMEHIDMFNILINATRKNPTERIDHMFAALKIPSNHDHFIIPGKKVCGRASYVPKRERKFSTRFTPPVKKIAPSATLLT
ncbi:uncharacterized protein LOC135836997 isoform X2 [Planococcus citri]